MGKQPSEVCGCMSNFDFMMQPPLVITFGELTLTLACQPPMKLKGMTFDAYHRENDGRVWERCRETGRVLLTMDCDDAQLVDE
jgi:hypothetical protein